MADNIRKPQEEIYNAPPNTGVEFDDFPFGDLEVRDLFWMSNDARDTFPHRKNSDYTAINLKTQTEVRIDMRQKVYVKT